MPRTKITNESGQNRRRKEEPEEYPEAKYVMGPGDRDYDPELERELLGEDPPESEEEYDEDEDWEDEEEIVVPVEKAKKVKSSNTRKLAQIVDGNLIIYVRGTQVALTAEEALEVFS